MRQKTIDNPQGFLRSAIQYGWRPPGPSLRPEPVNFINHEQAARVAASDPLSALTTETRLFENEAEAHRRWQDAF